MGDWGGTMDRNHFESGFSEDVLFHLQVTIINLDQGPR